MIALGVAFLILLDSFGGAYVLAGWAGVAVLWGFCFLATLSMPYWDR